MSKCYLHRTARSQDLGYLTITLHQPPGRLADCLDGRPVTRLSFINEAVMTEVSCIGFLAH